MHREGQRKRGCNKKVKHSLKVFLFVLVRLARIRNEINNKIVCLRPRLGGEFMHQHECKFSIINIVKV